MIRRRRVLVAFVAAAATLSVLAVVAAVRIPFSSETLRDRLIHTLEERLDVDADLASLTLRLYPEFRAVGTGLVLRSKTHPDLPPLIQVRTFTVDANLSGLWRQRVSFVRLDGLVIQIPPDTSNGDHAGPTPAGSAGHGSPLEYIKQVVIDSVDAPDASLALLRSDPSKPPRIWSLHHLHIQHVGVSKEMPFETTLTNAVPPGEIEAVGSFGPWSTDVPGRTPLEGEFTFDHADLSVFEGITGTLSAAGTFRGTLDRIDVSGRTETPDFRVNTGHPVTLSTTYHAVVDATNGNTTLDPIDATFLNTSITASGGVYEKDSTGRMVNLDLSINEGRLEDIMRLAVPAPRPPMSGRLRLTTKFIIPPGKRDIVDKLQLAGRFSIQRGQFTDEIVQKQVNELSRRASAHMDEDPSEHRVGSNFDGHFQMANSRLTLPTVTFDVPGAVVELHGQYGMKREDIAFNGNLYMDAKLSQTTTGWRSWLLKAVDPWFRRNGKTVVPLRIDGTRAAPKFGVDVGRVLRRSADSPEQHWPHPLVEPIPSFSSH